jgi:hypothetical protein
MTEVARLHRRAQVTTSPLLAAVVVVRSRPAGKDHGIDIEEIAPCQDLAS